MRWLGALFGVLLVGCGGEAEQGDGGAPANAEVAAGPAPLGWSVRDEAPYARRGHSMVIDTAADRMILFGGQGNDAWQLPLSGPDANRWQQFLPEGERPPPGDASAVYDAAGGRILARFDRGPQGGYPTAEIWELSLGDAPAWRRLDPGGAQVGAEIAQGMVALDATGERLFVVGGMGDNCGTWALSLGGEPTWTRVGNAPIEDCSAALLFLPEFGSVALVLDEPRQRLVAVTTWGWGQVWEMPLATGVWSMLTDVFRAPSGSAAIHDVEGERLVFASDQLWSFSLATGEIEALQPQPSLPIGSSAVFDTQRDRVLSFPSGTDSSVSQVSLTTLAQGKPLVRGTMGQALEPMKSMVWDEQRRAVVAFGGDTAPEAQLRTLSSTAKWQDLRAGAGPHLFGPASAYDTEGQALLSFGGSDFVGTDSSAVWRLASKPGAHWQELGELVGGPEARRNAVGVYDSQDQRLIVRGGEHNLGDYVYEGFDDVWALSLDNETWAKLEPTGESPGARYGEIGIYDSSHERLVVYGGWIGDAQQNDVHALTLGDAPTWSKLEPSGQPPAIGSPPSNGPGTALYDAEGERLLLVMPRDRTTEVFALELDDEPGWHRFCDIGPAPNPGYAAQHAVLTSDGILVALSNGAFRFNLETPYCD